MKVNFKAGDIVKPATPQSAHITQLYENKNYVVENVVKLYGGQLHIKIKGHPHFWRAERFLLVSTQKKVKKILGYEG